MAFQQRVPAKAGTYLSIPKGTTQLRFHGNRGASWTGDIAIDEFEITPAMAPLPGISTPCTIGKYSSSAKVSACATCPSGYSSLITGQKMAVDAGNLRGTTCGLCPVGKYTGFYGAGLIGAQECKACPKGKTTGNRRLPLWLPHHRLRHQHRVLHHVHP